MAPASAAASVTGSEQVSPMQTKAAAPLTAAILARAGWFDGSVSVVPA
jgi:hypothetical protein